MGRWGVILLLIGLLATPGRAQQQGEVEVRQSGTLLSSSCSFLDFLTTGFTATKYGSGCRVALSSSVTLAGSCIGDAAGDWCGTVDGSLGNPNWIMPNSASSAPTAKGGYRFIETGEPPYIEQHTGGTPSIVRYWSGLFGLPLGGSEYASDFTFAGETAGSCTGDCCRGGTPTGTTPNGICTFSYNADIFGRMTSTESCTVIKQYRNITISGGTVTTTAVAGTSTCPRGITVILLASGDITISTPATLDVSARGSRGSLSSTGLASSAGKTGGGSQVCAGGAGGTSGGSGNTGTAGGALQQTPDANWWPWLGRFWLGMGAGGGTVAVTFGGNGNAGVGAILVSQSEDGITQTWIGSSWGPPLVGGCGGGGGGTGITAGCTTSEGGRGGGNVHIEAGGTYTFASGTITVAGETPGTGVGGGGGGGGTVHVIARALGTDTGTYTVSGGSGDSGGATNCGAGGAGGSGSAVRHVALP